MLLLFYSLNGKDAQGQETPHQLNSKHSFGFNLGFTSGIGFSYRYMPNKFGIEVSSLPIYLSVEELIFLQGLSFNYVVKEKEHADYFIYAGNSTAFFPPNKISEGFNNSFLYRAGSGCGMIIHGEKALDWTLRLGATYITSFNGGNVLPSIGLGMHYRITDKTK